jgi:hypothetical protein
VGAASVIHTACRIALEEQKESEVLENPQLCEDLYNRALHQMASDLGLAKDHLRVLAHSGLHIDLDCFVGPGRKVFLTDPVATLLAVRTWLSDEHLLDPQLRGFYTTYAREVQQELEQECRSGVFEYNCRVLEEWGLVPIGIPNPPGDRNRDSADFLNGILFRDPSSGAYLFLTNAITRGSYSEGKCRWLPASNTGCHGLAELFSRSLRVHGIYTAFINQQGLKGGGLHCITQEVRTCWDTVVEPQSIPLPLSERLTLPTHLQVDSWGEAPQEAITLCLAADDCGVVREQVELSLRKSWSTMLEVSPFAPARVWLEIGKRPQPFQYLLAGHPTVLHIIRIE